MTGTHMLRLDDLPNRKPTHFTLAPDAPARAALADALGIVAIRKLRLAGKISPAGKRDWLLEAELGATVVQDCVVTLEPVTTRIQEPVLRRYLAEPPQPGSGEVEMPEDDSIEALPQVLDLAEVMAEALALALPAFPRAPGAELGNAVFADPGVTPLTDEAIKPFAGLAGLRDQLDEGGDDEE